MNKRAAENALQPTASLINVLLFMLLAACGRSPEEAPEVDQPEPVIEAPRPEETRPPEEARSPEFTCEGKTHCSQMGSCEEATFYIQNCPGTEMDGDHDGIPCESQWCDG
jgi:hypothetical protein